MPLPPGFPAARYRHSSTTPRACRNTRLLWCDCRPRPPRGRLPRTHGTGSVGARLERGLVFGQRGSLLSHVQQQVTEQLAHRIEAIFHRHRDAAVFIGGCAHERSARSGRLPRAQSSRNSEHLFLWVRSRRPIGLFECGAQRLHGLDPVWCQYYGRHAETAQSACGYWLGVKASAAAPAQSARSST